MKRLAELDVEYKISLNQINCRIKELSSKKDAAIAVCKKIHHDPKKDPAVCTINIRLRPLIEMQSDLREVAKEVKHYYDRRWWRSEKYTFNQWKSPKLIYVEPIYDKTGYECRSTTDDENYLKCFGGNRSYRQTATDYRNALFWWEKRS